MFWTLLRAHFNPRLTARAKMSLSRAQNIFMPANIKSIVLLYLGPREDIFKNKCHSRKKIFTHSLSILNSLVVPECRQHFYEGSYGCLFLILSTAKCPSGMFKSSKTDCSPCPAGTYNNQQGQLQCNLACPTGTSSLPGAKSSSDCKRKPDPCFSSCKIIYNTINIIIQFISIAPKHYLP